MMQSESANLIRVLEHAARFHAKVEVVSRCVEDDSLHRYTYADAWRRTQQLAHGLHRLGVRAGDRVATLAWNTYRHLEAWYAIAGQGAICHTVNPRLFPPQIEFIINHAEDKLLLVDLTFVPLLEAMQERLPSIEHVVLMTDEQHMPKTQLRNVLSYESLIESEPDEFAWPSLSGDTPSSLCYTSGTTGDPKGVLYTHCSNLLHARAIGSKDSLGIAGRDVVLVIVPMFHANSWGLAYACPMVGATLVLPGARLDGEHLYQLLDGEQASFSAAVPTIWTILLEYLKRTGNKLPYLEEVTIGGAAVPRKMIETLDREYGVTVVQGWGMTELSPIGTSCRLKRYMKSFSYDEQLDILVKQGQPLFGVAMKIVNEHGDELPHDGDSIGRLLVKGAWIIKRYYREETDAVDRDGWFDTGDMATIDEHGYMHVVDRAKDLIKSGGEWISSVALENAAMAHPAVGLAAVIGIPHEKWQERPLLVLKLVADAQLTRTEILGFLKDKVAKWWLPEEVLFVDDIPLTAAGKISKLLLRQQLLP